MRVCEGGALSRAAKLAWSRLRGAGEITSLQHDGVVMILSQGVTPTDACAALTEVCTAALGYAQPVEEKPRMTVESHTGGTHPQR